MPVTRRQAREYLEPAMRRKGFRFWQLRGLVDERTLSALRNGGAHDSCAHSGEQVVPMRSRSGDWGLLLRNGEVSGIPVSFMLGESSGASVGRGSLYLEPDLSGSMQIDVTQNGARLMEALDYWAADARRPPSRLELLRLLLVRLPRELQLCVIESRFRAASMRPEEIPVNYALDISCMRLLLSRFDSLAGESAGPREFVMRALNMHIDWALAHEASHLQESRACGLHTLHPTVKEIFAYLLQAVNSSPADAFLSMMNRGIDITLSMPSFDSAVRSLGPACFSMDEEFLRHWAVLMAGALRRIAENRLRRSVMLDMGPIVLAQTSDHVGESDMPLVERALCNPNLRALPHPGLRLSQPG